MKVSQKIKIILSILFVTALISCQSVEEEKPQIGQIGLGRGVNLGNALEAPQEGEWGVKIEEYFFDRIKEVEFQTVRIPVRWSAHTEPGFPYKINESFFQRVDDVINQALARDLNVIINIHHFNELTESPAENELKLYQIWRQIADRYSGFPDQLIFEPLNEPYGALTSDLWNQYLKNLLEIIRETHPDRTVVIGPVLWNALTALEFLVLPEDKNLIVTFHYYLPFQFTHQGAEWVEGSDVWLGTKWEGTIIERLSITSDLDKAVEWAEDKGVPLFMGEFGAYYKADYDSRVRWTRFMAREAEKRDIDWAYWEFGAGFGIYDINEDKWDLGLLDALMIPKKAKLRR